MSEPALTETETATRPGICPCGALQTDHLASFEGRCYLVKSPRTLKVPGARTLADAFKRKAVG